MTSVGDKTKFYNPELEEADSATYICVECGAEKEVAEVYDLFTKGFYPIRFTDTVCEKCDNYMDRKARR